MLQEWKWPVGLAFAFLTGALGTVLLLSHKTDDGVCVLLIAIGAIVGDGLTIARANKLRRATKDAK